MASVSVAGSSPPNRTVYCSCCCMVSSCTDCSSIDCLIARALACSDLSSENTRPSVSAAVPLSASAMSSVSTSASNAVNIQGKIPKSRWRAGMTTFCTGTGRITGRNTLLKFLALAWMEPAATNSLWSSASARSERLVTSPGGLSVGGVSMLFFWHRQ